MEGGQNVIANQGWSTDCWYASQDSSWTMIASFILQHTGEAQFLKCAVHYYENPISGYGKTMPRAIADFRNGVGS
eukprot:scaffold10414_cov102-Cylindrotheca_fusiformis.AAC.1